MPLTLRQTIENLLRTFTSKMTISRKNMVKDSLALAELITSVGCILLIVKNILNTPLKNYDDSAVNMRKWLERSMMHDLEIRTAFCIAK